MILIVVSNLRENSSGLKKGKGYNSSVSNQLEEHINDINIQWASVIFISIRQLPHW